MYKGFSPIQFLCSFTRNRPQSATSYTPKVSSNFITTLKLTNYRVLSTGIDGGHLYISTIIQHKGLIRQLTGMFKSKSDENKLSDYMEITVLGNLIDEGLQPCLILLDTEIIDGQ